MQHPGSMPCPDPGKLGLGPATCSHGLQIPRCGERHRGRDIGPPSFTSGWICAFGVVCQALKTPTLQRGRRMKVAIYVRVSTADQNEEPQLREPQDYANRHQWEIARVDLACQSP